MERCFVRILLLAPGSWTVNAATVEVIVIDHIEKPSET